MHPDFVILGRLVVAALLAGVLGWERERAGKSAGLRTHMLVGIAAALYTGLAEVASVELGAGRSDPLRAIQAVAMGIGFLGGGIIFVNRNDRVQGLTTAASIWATAAMGVAAGLGHFRLAAGVTVLLAIVLHVLARFDRSER
ncbi:MAG TPA: MgtC/SapB family protein [Gemmatimonadales bacterium]|nr:MgtC/SapB family protein [Gemmatimonadales bacterium]